MKLKNPIITNKLRVFYFEKGWSHKEVQKYLSDHYCTSVCVRTLKYWKKKLKTPNWQHPISPVPPVPKKVLSKLNTKRIINFRKKTSWGGLTIKHTFKFNCSESTIRRLIKKKVFQEEVKSKTNEYIGLNGKEIIQIVYGKWTAVH